MPSNPYRARYLSQGLCPDCSGKRPLWRGLCRCEECHEDHALAQSIAATRKLLANPPSVSQRERVRDIRRNHAYPD